MTYPKKANWLYILGGLLMLTATPISLSQKQGGESGKPVITVTEVPPYDCGGPDKQATIAGKVTGIPTNDLRIVIYSHACNGVFYVQPTVAQPYTKIDANGSWESYIHLGHTYWVLLVKPAFKPKSQLEKEPEEGDDILAIVKVRGKKN